MDENIWTIPSPARRLTVTKEAQDNLSWNEPLEPGCDTGVITLEYDLLRSTDPSSFSNATCVESNGTDLTASDTGTPGPGPGFYYLVRVEDPCGGEGNMGETSGGTPRTGTSCP
jgi:hypothetical protein